VRYLCGFTGSSAALLVLSDRAILFTDSRYTLQAHEEAPETEVETVDHSVLAAAVRAASGKGSVGFESDHMSVAEHASLSCGENAPALVPTRGLVERLRAVKDQHEIEAIQASLDLSARAFEAGLGALERGATEVEIAAAVEHEMRRGGASAPAFESIVASGPRAACPHARASMRRPGAGEPVVMDIGARLDGYASDMTRTVFAGDPGETGRRIHSAVLEALTRAEAEVRPGVAAAQVDGAARKALSEAGFAEAAYRHGTGHGIGLEVHEAPRIGPGRDEILEAGMVLTLEPGIYIEGWGGVRIEDVVAVEAGGCRLLTTTPRSMISL